MPDAARHRSPGEGPRRSLDGPDAGDRLVTAPLEVVGRFVEASNATLLVRLTDRDPRPLAAFTAALGREPTVTDLDPADLAVYKPARGEAPLWDFPAGTLHRREVAAYEVSRALGWDLVPVTRLREDAPFGPGSLQRFVAHDPDEHYFWLVEQADEAIAAQLAAMVVFDLVVDNADRKGGHVLLEADGPAPGRLRLVDHGVTFNLERKLRTVAWHLAGEPIPAPLRRDVANLDAGAGGALATTLDGLLAPPEIDAFRDRVAAVARLDRFPSPTGRHPYPWPLV